MLINKFVLILSVFLGLAVSGFCLAVSNTSGYAWSNNIGWINFGCDQCNVQVTDSAVTGYAWSENYGWINLNPSTSGVKNTTHGVLSGYAWGENLGWINFDGTNITCEGKFAGILSGDVVGSVNLACSNCNIQTDWIRTGGCGGQTSHKECSAQTGQCISVNGLGEDQCSSNDNCQAHNVCNSQTHQCESVAGEGTDECQSNDNCVVHNECNAQKQCVQVTGLAEPDQCQEASDCNLTHTICDGDNIFCRYDVCTGITCVEVNGLGEDQCSTDAQCSGGVHSECDARTLKCILVDGVSPNLCVEDEDCDSTYKLCENNSCVQKHGVGTDQCQIDSDCATSHKECVSSQCVVVVGPGVDGCQENINCSGPEVTHRECAQDQCVIVSGAGNDQCVISADCNVTHNECNEQEQCVAVNGLGIDQCQNDDSCKLSKHNECNAELKCVAVNGVGSNLCQTDENCIITHNECNLQNQCVAINGSGINQCQGDPDCQPGRHNECRSGQCVAIDGSAPDSCQVNNDCAVSHNECSGSQCVSVPGIGINQCVVNGDCFTPRHNICDNQRCIATDGAEPDQCQTDRDCNGGGGGGGGTIQHTECNQERKCVYVDGSSEDKCVEDEDCEEKTPIEIITKTIEDQIPEPVKAAVKQTQKIIETPQASAITKTVTTTVATVATVATVSSLVTIPFFDIILTPIKLLGLLLTALGIRKRVVPWGVVYDSITKRPLDPAYVTITNIKTGEASSAITDLDGRYGFLVSPGIYKIEAKKTNYSFPSKTLAGKTGDELHSDLYFGDTIEIKTVGAVILKNIPLDPIKFDWNEFAKKDKNLMKFYSRWDILLGKLYDWSFVVGFVVAVVAYAFAPYPYNTIIMMLYLVLLLLRIFGLKPKASGHIFNKATGEPLSFAIVRVLIPGSNVVVASKPADKYGRYYCLVSPGEYYVKIERKNKDGSYSLAYTSPVINMKKKGIIKQSFKV